MKSFILFLFIALIFILLIMYNQKKHFNRHLNDASKKSFKEKSTLLNEYHLLFADIGNKASKIGINIHTFSYFNSSSKALNGNSSIPRVILITPSWFCKTASGNPVWYIALLHLLGHELAHKTNEPFFCLGFTKRGQFKNWVREIRADFWGLKFVEDNYQINRINILEAIGEKIKYNSEITTCISNGTRSHPSGAFRYMLLSKYTIFNDEVVKCVAKELNYANSSYIEKLISQLAL